MHSENHGESIEEQDLLVTPEGEEDVHEVIAATADSFSEPEPVHELEPEVAPLPDATPVDKPAIVLKSAQRRTGLRQADSHIKRSRFAGAVSPRRTPPASQGHTPQPNNHESSKKALIQG